MKKLYLALLSLLCWAVLATPVSADVLSPVSIVANAVEFLIIPILILLAGFVLYKLLRNRKK